VKLWRLNGGDWPLVHGEFGLVLGLDHGSASTTDFEHLPRRGRRLEVLWLRLWLWSLRNVSVPVVKLEVSGEGDGQMGAFGIHAVGDL
jgi:hypothetical protein